MQRFLMIIFLEGYAIFLALMQGLNGVRTDEAKYLLNIPYPHPPLVRWIIGQTEWMANQELFWRIIFATLLVQAVWMVIRMCHPEEPRKIPHHDTKGWASRRMILGASWLLSAALWVEGGKIMMTPLTAVQGLLFIYFLLKASEAKEAKSCLCIGLLWLVSLFTAYQAVLYLPIVIAVFWRMRIPVWYKLVYVGGPLVLLDLYTLTNPLIIASMVNVSGQQVSVPLMERLGGVLDLWLIGGSLVVGVLGVLGMVRARNVPLVTSLVLVCVYIFVAHRAYYSILFLPLLIGGLVCLIKEQTVPIGRFVGLMVMIWMIFALQHPLVGSPNRTQEVMSHVPQEEGLGDILIAGTFGHEWQYSTDVPVRRYKPELLSKAQAAICLSPCAEIEWRGWKRILDGSVRIYVPKGLPLPAGRED